MVYIEDFKIDDVTHVSGIVDKKFIDAVENIDNAVTGTYRGRLVLKTFDEIIQRHKKEFKKGSSRDIMIKLIDYHKTGPLLVMVVGDIHYVICPTNKA